MIEKRGAGFVVICDICGRESEEVFCDFYEAVDYKKESGWKSQKYKGDWEDVCPDCFY